MRRSRGARREPGSAPHTVLAAADQDTAVADLVANLAVRTGAASTAFHTATDDHPSVGWPPGPANPAPVSLRAPVLDGTTPRGELLLHGAAVTEANGQVLAETAACVAVALRGRRLRAQLRTTAEDVRRLDGDLRATREHLALVRDAERRRLVAAIVGATAAQLAGVRDTVRHVAGGDPLALDTLRKRLGELIDGFRTVVRGVHPTVLREHGPLVALEELAADLPRPVRFDGKRFRRAGWEVESGFYHAVAAVLPVFTASGGPHPLQVTLGYDTGRLLALIRDEPAHGAWIGRIRDALAVDADRIAALGGSLVPEVTEAGIAVTVTMGGRFGRPSVTAPPESDTPGADEVWALLIRLRALADDGVRTDRARAAAWAAIGERLDEPPRLAVTGPGAAAMLDTLLGAEVRAGLPAGVPIWFTAGPVARVTVWPRDHGRPDRAPLSMARLPATAAELARVDRLAVQWPSAFLRDVTLIHPTGPPTAVDAVLHVFGERPDPEDTTVTAARSALVIGVASSDCAEEVAEQTCDLTVRLDPRGSGLAELTAVITEHLAADGDLVVARAAVRAMAVLTRRGGPAALAGEIERIAVTSRPLVEFEVLSALRTATLSLPDSEAAIRLLGGRGRAPRSRLDLPADASDTDVTTAAEATAQTWWRHAAAHSAASPERDACQVLAQTAAALGAPRA